MIRHFHFRAPVLPPASAQAVGGSGGRQAGTDARARDSRAEAGSYWFRVAGRTGASVQGCSPAGRRAAALDGGSLQEAGEAAAPACGRGQGTGQPPYGSDPLADLLRSLRGHQVTLQVGERLVTGKLITADPIIIVGPAGEATMVAPDAVKSVQF